MTPKGTDLEELCRKGPETMSFEYDDQEWEVKYRKVDWKLRFNSIESAWKTHAVASKTSEQPTEEVWFDTAQYYEEMFMAAIIDVNGQKVTLPLLRQFDGPVITYLTTIVPGPSLITDLAKAKKDLRPSDTEPSPEEK